MMPQRTEVLATAPIGKEWARVRVQNLPVYRIRLPPIPDLPYGRG